MKSIFPLFCLLLCITGCESETEPTRTVLNAGMGKGNEIKKGSDLDFMLQATHRVFPKERWITHYRYEFASSNAVVLVRIDSKEEAVCTDVWKAKTGLLRVGDHILLGVIPGHLDEGTQVIVWFRSYPNQADRSAEFAPKGGYFSGDLSAAEIRAAVLEKKANQAAEPTRTTVTPPAGAGDHASGARGSP